MDDIPTLALSTQGAQRRQRRRLLALPRPKPPAVRDQALAGEAEAVVGTAFGVGLALFDDDFPLVMMQPGFVFDVPAQRLEKRRYEVDTRLRFLSSPSRGSDACQRRTF